MSHKKYRSEKNCLNCGAIVDKKFCAECGQENLDTKENFLHLAGHFIADYFHYDSKFFTNLKFLIVKPGFLTKEYLEGKRMRHIHPLRLYFFITIVMVIVANIYYKKFEKEIKGSHITYTADGESVTLDTVDKVSEEDEKILNKLTRGFDNISYYLKYISFFLLPAYALVFKLLYWRRKRFYVDHLVFTLHLQSFAYLILSLVLLIPIIISPESRDWLGYLLIFVVTIYLIISLRFLYQQSWGKTILKSMIAVAVMMVVTLLAIIPFIAIAFY